MRKTKEYEFFGQKYRVKQFSAVDGVSYLFAKDYNLEEYLSCSEVMINSEWEKLDSKEKINKYVIDCAGVIAPTIVISALLKFIEELNFAFIPDWKPVKVPTRFLSGAKKIEAHSTHGIISQIIQDGAATKRELEEYYSLHDAFEIMDVMTVKGLNAAISSEMTMKERARER